MPERTARRVLAAVVLTVVLAMALGVFGLWVLLTPKGADAGRGPAAEAARGAEGPHVAQAVPPVQSREEVHKTAVDADSPPSAQAPTSPRPLHMLLISELLITPLPTKYSPMLGSEFPGVEYDLLTSFRNTSEYKELMALVRAQGQEGADAVMDHIMSIVRARHEAGLELCAGNMGPLLELGHMEPGYAMCLPLILPEIDASQREVNTLLQFIDEDVAARTESVRSRLPDKKDATAISVGSLFLIHALDCYMSSEYETYADDPTSFSQEQFAVLQKYGRLKESIRSLESDSGSLAAVPPEERHQIDYDRNLLSFYGQWVPTDEFPEPSYDEEIVELARAYWQHSSISE